MVKCSAYRCESASHSILSLGLSFHRFPSNESNRNAWIKNMKVQDWQPSSASVLCSKHFEEHWIETSSFRTRLRFGAIPTLFELPPVEEDKENVSWNVPKKRSVTGEIVPGPSNNEAPASQPLKVEELEPQELIPDTIKSEQIRKLKRKISLKNKKIKALEQQRRRLRKKVSQFSEIISDLKNKLNLANVQI